jgi:hypothetical protein
MMNLWQQPGHKTLGHSVHASRLYSTLKGSRPSHACCFQGKTSQVKPRQKEATLEVKQPVELIASAIKHMQALKTILCFVNLSTAMAVSTLRTRVPPPT